MTSPLRNLLTVTLIAALAFICPVGVLGMALPCRIVPCMIREDYLIQMLFLIIPLVAFLVLVYLILHYRQKALQDRNRVIEESIRCNRQLPPEFFGGSRADDPTNAQSPTDMAMLRNGIIWISIGLAVFFFFVNAREEELAVLGIIPIGIGIGKMLPWILKRNQNSSRQPYHNNYPPQYPPSSNDPSLSNNPNNNYNNSNNSNNYNNSNNSNNYNNPNNSNNYNNPTNPPYPPYPPMPERHHHHTPTQEQNPSSGNSNNYNNSNNNYNNPNN